MSTMDRHLAPVAAPAAVLLALWGCGGSSPTGPGAGSAGGDGDGAVAGARSGRVEVTPDSASVAARGDTVRLEGRARDAAGRDVPGDALSWSVSGDGVATVDDAGLVTALANGVARVVAAAPDGAADTASIRVSFAAPRVASISPGPLVEGRTAIVEGQHFSPDAASNRITVDGVTVTAATATAERLTFTVPTFACRPPRDAVVRVTTAGTSGPELTRRVEPDAAPLELAVGQQAVLRGPGEPCLRFAESAEAEAYLVGVQSVSAGAGPTVAEATARADAAGAKPVAAALLGDEAGDEGGTDLRADPRLERHARAHLRHRLRERAELSPKVGDALRGRDGREGAWGGLAASVSVGVEEGDTVEVRVPDISTGTCSDFTEIEARVRVKGTHGLWVTDVDNPAAGELTDAEIRAVAGPFDDVTHPTAEAYFGALPDNDGNGRAVFVVTREVNRLGGLLGFVSGEDLFPRSSCASSDQGELTYLVAPDPDGLEGRSLPKSIVLDEAPRLVAHEYTHMIQLARRSQAGHDWPAVWITEGQATFAEEVQGHAATGRSPGSNYGADVALNRSGADETDWYRNRFADLSRYFGFRGPTSRVEDAPEACSWVVRGWGSGAPCVGARSVYGTPSTLLRWLSDHVGADYPGGERALHRDIVDSGRTGFANLAALTGIPRSTMLAQWAAMLWVDDRVPGADPRLTLPSWDLPDVFSRLPESGRLRPRERTFGDFSESVEVNGASTAYFRISGSSRPATALGVEAGGGAFPDHMQVWVVRLQ